MAQDPRTIVRTSTRPWSEEVARADARDAMETAGMPFPADRGEDAYRFSGRTFKRPPGNPYTDGT